jgi:hypothetical protein
MPRSSLPIQTGFLRRISICRAEQDRALIWRSTATSAAPVRSAAWRSLNQEAREMRRAIASGVSRYPTPRGRIRPPGSAGRWISRRVAHCPRNSPRVRDRVPRQLPQPMPDRTRPPHRSKRSIPRLGLLARGAQKPMPCAQSIPPRRFRSECRGECLPPSACQWPGCRLKADLCRACFGLETGRRSEPAIRIVEVERPRPYSPFIRHNSTFADFGAIRNFNNIVY